MLSGFSLFFGVVDKLLRNKNQLVARIDADLLERPKEQDTK
jgi:hypothetical protein